MTGDLLTVEDVAAVLRISPDLAKALRVRDQWPCVQFSRKTIRYSAADLAAIVTRYHSTPSAAVPVGLPGQSERSRQRSAP